MPRECLYKAITESGSLDREGMMDVVGYFFPDMPDLIHCYRCNTSCQNSMVHDNPQAVLTELERVRIGLTNDPDLKYLEVPKRPGHKSHLSFPVVLQDPCHIGNRDVKPQRPQRVYIDPDKLSGDPKTDSQVIRDYQQSHRVETPAEEDLESVLI